MCYRCIGKTFLVSVLLGASVAMIGFETRSYLARRDAATLQPYHAARANQPPRMSAPRSVEVRVSFSFEEAPLSDVARFVSNVTHEPILAALDVDTAQRVSFVSLQPISAAELGERFQRLLEQRGLGLAHHKEFAALTQLPRRVVPLTGYLAAPRHREFAELSIPTTRSIVRLANAQLNRATPKRHKLSGASAEVTWPAEGCSSKTARFSSVAVGSLWSRLGLRSGDSFSFVDSLPLGGDDDTLEITRDGAPMRLRYEYSE